MSTKTIENFFTGKTLVIPSYQRDYAWRESNVDDLFADIEEALGLYNTTALRPKLHFQAHAVSYRPKKIS